MSRAPVLVGLVVVLAGGVAWWALRGEPEAPPPAPVPEPRAEPMDPLRQREISHRDPWPHAAFEPDFQALRSGGITAGDDLSEEKLTRANELRITPQKVSIHFESATVADVVRTLDEQLAPSGVKVFTYETNDTDHLRFKLAFDAIEVYRLIDELRWQSSEDLRYYTTSQGLCIGSERAIQQAQLDARADIARRRAERDRASPVFSKEFRPDFADAWIGPIARMIRDQTGVEVVVDQPTWTNGRQLTWRADPMPLREALDRIGREMGCVARVRDGRIFLLAP